MAPAPKTLHASSSSTSSVTATAMATRSRNQFSTYQQHFSPKKTQPPAPAQASGGPEQGPLIPASWPEVAALQTELLQLSILHQSGHQRNDRWERDAEAHLRSKYDAVSGDYGGILNVEKETQRKINGQALHYWMKSSREHHGQHGFTEQVQLLSQIAQEVYGLSDGHGGRHNTAILEFESWLRNVEKVQEARAKGHCDEFINPIHRNWKDETNALIMKLELASRQLQTLDILGHGEVETLNHSALLRTVKNLDEIVTKMSQELNVVRQIEADIVQQETTRVSQLAQHLVESQPREDPPPRTGLWTASFKA